MKTSISDTNTSLQSFMPFTGASFINGCLLNPGYTSIIYCFS